MKWSSCLLALAGLPASAAAAEPVFTQKAAKVEASGFATVKQAPPSPFPDRLPPPENRPKNETGFYAQMAGVSDAEAQKRMAEQRAARPEFTRLIQTLRSREAGNFTDARIIHKPDWAYVFYFKRNPAATLAKYTRKPHFQAAQARYSRDELQAIAKPWAERFSEHRLLGGYGTDATYGEIRMDLVVSEPEFRAIADRERWEMPDAIRLSFSQAVTGAAVLPSISALVRVFPQSDRSLGPTHQALLGGRIVLRDGCFYITGPNQPDRLAYFAREVSLGLDDQGYLALRTRGPSPRHLGRIGEPFSWGGPIGTTETMPMVRELRARCGSVPLEHVGVPESSRLFAVRPWVIDAIAERRKINREEAWRRFKKCHEVREARGTAPILDCDTV